MIIQAFTETYSRTWEHKLSIRDSYHHQGKVLSINPPVEYNLDEYFISGLSDPERGDLLCIDAGGRNYGVRLA